MTMRASAVTGVAGLGVVLGRTTFGLLANSSRTVGGGSSCVDGDKPKSTFGVVVPEFVGFARSSEMLAVGFSGVSAATFGLVSNTSQTVVIGGDSVVVVEKLGSTFVVVLTFA